MKALCRRAFSKTFSTSRHSEATTTCHVAQPFLQTPRMFSSFPQRVVVADPLTARYPRHALVLLDIGKACESNPVPLVLLGYESKPGR